MERGVRGVLPELEERPDELPEEELVYRGSYVVRRLESVGC